MGTATLDLQQSGRSPVDGSGIHGWSDWAEWVEPVEWSLAAVSASVFAERAGRLYGPDRSPDATHVAVLVDVGTPGEPPARSHASRVATMAELRAHFPFVDAIAALGPSRYAVLARRHTGLAWSLGSLEARLQADPAGLGTVAAVWCDELPATPEDVPAFVRGIRIKAPSRDQQDRGALAAGPPVEVLARNPVTDTDGSSVSIWAVPRRVQWVGQTAVSAVFAATLAFGASGAAVVGAAVSPWRLGPLGVVEDGAGSSMQVTRAAAGTAATDILSFLASPSFLEQLIAILTEAEARGVAGAGHAESGLGAFAGRTGDAATSRLPVPDGPSASGTPATPATPETPPLPGPPEPPAPPEPPPPPETSTTPEPPAPPETPALPALPVLPALPALPALPVLTTSAETPGPPPAPEPPAPPDGP